MVNKVILIGNVGADPEVRSMEGGVKVARVRVATTERIYNRQTQEAREHTEWHSVTVWRGVADFVDNYVKKGSQVYVEGPLRNREWTDEAGNKRYATEILANEFRLLGRRSDNPAQQSPGQGGAQQQQAPAQQGAAPQYQSQAAAPKAQSAPAADLDDPDDLPF